jgi:hypothetical protein
MRIWLTIIVAVLLCGTALATTDPQQQLNEAKRNAEHDPSPKHFAEVVRAEVEVADQQFTAGDNDKAQATIKELLEFTQKTVAAATGKHHGLKDAEIDLRKAEYRLNDVLHSLDADDQPPVKKAIEQLEDARKDLLALMFPVKK